MHHLYTAGWLGWNSVSMLASKVAISFSEDIVSASALYPSPCWLVGISDWLPFELPIQVSVYRAGLNNTMQQPLPRVR